MVNVTNKFVKTAPRKIRLILDAIRGTNAEVALSKLQFMPNTAARDIYNTLHSAVATAKENGLTTDNLIVIRAFCNEGPRIKRRIMISHGRARGINKQMSHIHLSLSTPTAKTVKES
ncbi:MAG: 50S ribosomal protein L22 [Patescibacteria group bacterium]|jgi:large subunit ribosomal protein L22